MTDRRQQTRQAPIESGVFGTPATFNGMFTHETRTLMRGKRRALGASRQQLAEMMGVSVSVLRKWESGRIVRCQARHVRRIVRFLRGDFDRALRSQNIMGRGLLRLWLALPEGVHECLSRALELYRGASKQGDAVLLDGRHVWSNVKRGLAGVRKTQAAVRRQADDARREERHGEG